MLALFLASAGIALVSGAIEVSGLDQGLLSRGDPEALLRVSVYDAEQPDGAPPVLAVLGSYEVEGGTLRFRPMFPFTPGLTYRVALRTREGERVELVTVPPRTDRPKTVVTELYPTTDVLPENQLKLYLHFSTPMGGGDGLPFVRLLDASGNEVEDPFLPLGAHFWDPERRRYTIFFDPGRVKRGILPNEEMGRPLVQGERYRLVVDPAWRDENGLPLASPFEKSFRAGPPDEEPIDPEAWTLSPPRALTREPFTVSFGEPLDREILLHALVIEDSRGRRLEGDGVVSIQETTWSFTPATPWEPGGYFLVARGILEDLAGNRIGRAFEVDVFEQIDSASVGARGEEKDVHRIGFVIGDGSR